MKNQTNFFKIFLALAGFLLLVNTAFNGYAFDTRAYNKLSYYGQYNYRYNSAQISLPFYLQNSYRQSGAANYVAGYGQIGRSPFLMTGRTCSFAGCTTTANSHIFVRNAVDNAYYNNPSLFNPRYSGGNRIYVRSAW